MIVPSLASYAKYDGEVLKKGILLGTSLSFLIYATWNILILGSLPQDKIDLFSSAVATGHIPPSLFRGTNSFWFNQVLSGFTFLAIITSYIGISWGLFDLLADTFKISKKRSRSRIFLVLAVVLPTLWVATSSFKGFIGLIESTGAYGDTILSCMIPALMLFIGVYKNKRSPQTPFLAHKALLGTLFSISLGIIILQLFR
jgi:tyrosine-specific transport protein